MRRIVVGALFVYLVAGAIFAAVDAFDERQSWQCPDPSRPGWVYGTDATPHGPGCRPEETVAEDATTFAILTVGWLPLPLAHAAAG